MALQNVNVGLAITGSYCTFEKVMPEIDKLIKAGAKVYPILSYSASNTDTRFGTAQEFKNKLEDITHNKIIDSMIDVEPIGPKGLIDVMLVAPCTGNTLAKLANAITDSPVLMACKAHLRNCKPVVIAISTNDALGANAKNLGLLLNIKNIYFVPFGQDNPKDKPNSLIAKMEYLIPAIEYALEGKQIQPLLV